MGHRTLQHMCQAVDTTARGVLLQFTRLCFVDSTSQFLVWDLGVAASGSAASRAGSYR